MNFLNLIIETTLPYIIAVLEIIGILVVTGSSIVAFFHYVQNAFMKMELDVQTSLSKGLVVGLEFVMAAEILKTILIQSLEEIYILGGIIVLRVALSLLIHFENKSNKAHKDNKPENTDKAEK